MELILTSEEGKFLLGVLEERHRGPLRELPARVIASSK